MYGKSPDGEMVYLTALNLQGFPAEPLGSEEGFYGINKADVLEYVVLGEIGSRSL